MKRNLTPATFVLVIVLAVLVNSVGCRYQSAACKQRGADLAARDEKLKQEAREQLKIGTKKESVTRFFAEHGLPLEFTDHYANGTIHVTRCAPSGCGSDDALFGLRVTVDEEGTVISEPHVGGMYTDCL